MSNMNVGSSGNRSIETIELILINLVAAFMHFGYEVLLWHRPGAYQDYVMTINMVSGVLFLVRAIGLVLGGAGERDELLWWIYFVIIVSVIWTSVSTLDMVEYALGFMPIHCSLVLVTVGLVAAMLAGRQYFRRAPSRCTENGPATGARIWTLVCVNGVAGTMFLVSAITLLGLRFHHRDFDLLCTLSAAFFCINSAIMLLRRTVMYRWAHLRAQVMWWIGCATVFITFGTSNPLFPSAPRLAGGVMIVLALAGSFVGVQEIIAASPAARGSPGLRPAPARCSGAPMALDCSSGTNCCPVLGSIGPAPPSNPPVA